MKTEDYIEQGAAIEVIKLSNRTVVIGLVLPDSSKVAQVHLPFNTVDGEIYSPAFRNYESKMDIRELGFISRMPAPSKIEHKYINLLVQEYGVPELRIRLGDNIVEALLRRRMYVGA